MRILLVSEDIPYPQMGGLAKHVLNLARALVHAGHEVDLLGGDAHPIEVIGEEGHFGGRFFGELNGHDKGWKESRIGAFVPSRRTWVAKRFAKIIVRHAANYNVVHYHGHAPNVASYIPAKINFVQTRHDHGSDCVFNTRFKDGQVCTASNASHCSRCQTDNPNILQKTVSTIAVRRYRREVADGFTRHKTIFVSDMLRRNFARTMGGEGERWGSVMHHFLDEASIEHARKFSNAMQNTEHVNVFVAGKLYAVKGVETFLREFHSRQTSHMTLTIAGDGPDAQRLRAEYESDAIRFLGWCTPEKTLEMTASSTVVVVPSLWEEPFGATTLEGLMLGKPTFALNRGATPELSAYVSYPGQLRIHPDMASLVADLVSFVPAASPLTLQPVSMASASHAVERLVDIYTCPTGFVSVRETNVSPLPTN